jgi:hypothetical protein
VEDADSLTVDRLAHLEDEAAAIRAIVTEDGPMLRKPLVSPKGEVLGETTYAHPGLLQLRKIGAEAADLCDALGLTPVARKALGLTVADERLSDNVDHLKERRRNAVPPRGLLSNGSAGTDEAGRHDRPARIWPRASSPSPPLGGEGRSRRSRLRSLWALDPTAKPLDPGA